jgi:hypothetical protein
MKTKTASSLCTLKVGLRKSLMPQLLQQGSSEGYPPLFMDLHVAKMCAKISG